MVNSHSVRVTPIQHAEKLPALSTTCEMVRASADRFALKTTLVPSADVLNHQGFRGWLVDQIELITQSIGDAVKSLKGLAPGLLDQMTQEVAESLREQLITELLAPCGLAAGELEAILSPDLRNETKIILVRSALLTTALNEVVPPNLREQLLERPRLLEQFFDCWFHSSDPAITDVAVLKRLADIDQKLKGIRPLTIEVEYKVGNEAMSPCAESKVEVAVI